MIMVLIAALSVVWVGVAVVVMAMCVLAGRADAAHTGSSAARSVLTDEPVAVSPVGTA